MAIDSDQVNYLVLRYLSESGFEHAAFSLKSEMRNADTLDEAWASRVPTGKLIDSLQRALMFEECLAQIDENGGEKDPADVLPASLIPDNDQNASPRPAEAISVPGNGMKKTQINSATSIEKRRRSPPETPTEVVTNNGLDHSMTDVADEVSPAAIAPNVRTMTNGLDLKGHSAGLDQALWHPVEQNVLATSSIDGTARIWSLPQREGETVNSIALSCLPSRTQDKSVTSMAWNMNGTFLATGSYDGVARIWASSGSKQHRDLTFHTGPVFTIKWSRRGDFVLTGGADGLIGVWNTSLGTLQQKWDLKSPVMEIEWISDALFLSATKDGSLRMWQLGRDANVKHFLGHTADINVLKWNSNINLGATGGDDALVKVWRADSEHPTQLLKAHRAQIHAMEWAPKDHGDYRLLASASRDGQVCIWDVVRGELIHVLLHDRAIFALHFSPTNLLATGGDQGEVSVWNGTTGKMLAVSSSTLDAGVIQNLKFSTNGERIVLASSKRGIVLTLPPT